MHDLTLITTLAAAFTSAWILGLATQKLRLSPIVGYLLAGIVIGPHTPGFIGDIGIAQQLAEVGVILLMFGVGLHFHLADLLVVRRVAVPGAIGQSLAATLVGIAVFGALGFSTASGAVLGMAMAVASTVLLTRVLVDARALTTPEGRVAIGWLIVEDILTVVFLVLLPALAQGADEPGGSASVTSIGIAVAIALAKLAALVALLFVVGSRVVPWALVHVARLRSRELFTLTVLVFSLAIAAGSYLVFGVSMALGAFLAGMVVAQSPVSHQAAADALPLRDAFAVLFFVSVGMLFDPSVLAEEPAMILAALGIILVVKPLAALVIVAVSGRSSLTALTVALGLAQIGEFSFILSDLGRSVGLMTDVGHSVLVAAAILSITINPLLFRAVPALEARLRARPALWHLLNRRVLRGAQLQTSGADAPARRESGSFAVVVGFGPVGRSVTRLLRDAAVPTVVVDLNPDTIASQRAQGHSAVYGDASRGAILEDAGVTQASHVIVTLPEAADRAAVIAAARHLNARARILVRARYLAERADLELAGASVAIFEEAEAAVALARVVLADGGIRAEAAESKLRDLRLQLILDDPRSIRGKPVRRVQVPWSRVHRLSAAASREQVLAQVSAHRHTRWPVVDPATARAVGYVLTKDVVSEALADQEWTHLMRPLRAVGPADDLEDALARMRGEGATIFLVEVDGRPVGIVTLEDILEQVVGRMDDVLPRVGGEALADAVRTAGVFVTLRGRTCGEVIEELASACPADKRPPGTDVAQLALAREALLSTDLGHGVAVPHARCPNVKEPVVLVGRSPGGVLFSPQSTELVRLVFLIIAPEDRPEVQLTLLAEIAAAVSDPAVRERLDRATSAVDVVEALSGGVRLAR